MPKTRYEANKNANKRYRMKFEEIKIRVPKGLKEECKALAKEENTSLNNLILEMLAERLERREEHGIYNNV